MNFALFHCRQSRVVAVALAAGVAVVAASTGCVPSRAFRCSDDAQCVNGEARGLCQDAGYCAYFDPTCPNELRYEANAEDDLGGACVGEGPDDEISCFAYCELGAVTCPGWPSFDQIGACDETCQFLPFEGEPDSLQCRYNAVVAAALEGDELGCLWGSLSGGLECRNEDSPSCEELCFQFEDSGVCAEWNQFEDPEVCPFLCSAFRPGGRGDVGANTIGCRLTLIEDTPDSDACLAALDPEPPMCVDMPA